MSPVTLKVELDSRLLDRLGQLEDLIPCFAVADVLSVLARYVTVQSTTKGEDWKRAAETLGAISDNMRARGI